MKIAVSQPVQTRGSQRGAHRVVLGSDEVYLGPSGGGLRCNVRKTVRPRVSTAVTSPRSTTTCGARVSWWPTRSATTAAVRVFTVALGPQPAASGSSCT